MHIPAGDKLEWLDGVLAELPDDEPQFCGYVTALTYEAGYLCDDAIAADPRTQHPLISLRRVDAVHVYDRLTGTAELQFSPECGHARRDWFKQKVESFAEARMNAAASAEQKNSGLAELGEMSASQYEHRVAALQERIRRGDFYECNFTQRFRCDSLRSPSEVARRLLAAGLPRHSMFIDLGHVQIVSASPEQFVYVHNSRIYTSPIKGTIARSNDNLRDQLAREQLSGSEKDHAEHTMVVDMARNDLGRICETGSVHVTRPYVVEPHKAVHHLVSTVEGSLVRDVPISVILRATFPAASITGAPKIAAVRAIREAELSPREYYTGALGVLNKRGIDLSVAIRTLVGRASGEGYRYELGSGGAVVTDSDPAAEYQECLLKASAVASALMS